METLLYILSYCAGIALCVHLMIRFPGRALVVSLLLVPLVILFSDTSDWGHSFDWVKRAVIILPTTIYLWAHFRHFKEDRGQRWVTVMKWVLFLNILVAVPPVFEYSVFNGCLLSLITLQGLFVPWRKSHDKRVIGFDSPAWAVAQTASIFHFYMFSPLFANSFVAISFSFALAPLLAFIFKDMAYWLPGRAFPLYVFIVSDCFFNKGSSKYIYPEILHKESRALLEGSILDVSLLCVAVVSTAWVTFDLVRRHVTKTVAEPC